MQTGKHVHTLVHCTEFAPDTRFGDTIRLMTSIFGLVKLFAFISTYVHYTYILHLSLPAQPNANTTQKSFANPSMSSMYYLSTQRITLEISMPMLTD